MTVFLKCLKTSSLTCKVFVNFWLDSFGCQNLKPFARNVQWYFKLSLLLTLPDHNSSFLFGGFWMLWFYISLPFLCKKSRKFLRLWITIGILGFIHKYCFLGVHRILELENYYCNFSFSRVWL